MDAKGAFVVMELGTPATAGDLVRTCADHGIQLGGQ